MKGTNEINPEFNGNGKAVPLLEKLIDDTIAKTLPVIPPRRGQNRHRNTTAITLE